MPLIEDTMFGRVDKVEQAVNWIKFFDPSKSETMLDLAPYYVAYSGGKDSDVIRILCALADVKHELVHNHTTVDAPETVRYVRSIPEVRINKPELSMWQLIVKKRMPPTRVARYCCEELKERGGKRRIVMTGVRWAESLKRKNSRAEAEIQSYDIRKTLMLNADNHESRDMFEDCEIKGKRVLNPIIDWTDADVWEFLKHYGCESNPLYQCGYSRVGCVGCPMAGKTREIEFARWPKYKENYIRSFQRMVDCRKADGLATEWNTGEEVFDWWMRDKNLDKQIEGQVDLWEDEEWDGL